MSWKPAWKVFGEGDKWCTNAQAFATEGEARDSAGARFGRWTQATDYTALKSDEAVTYRRENNIDIRVTPTPEGND